MMWEMLWGFEPALITGFVIAGLILNLTPGADFLFIMSSGLSGGPRIGVAAALGARAGVSEQNICNFTRRARQSV